MEYRGYDPGEKGQKMALHVIASQAEALAQDSTIVDYSKAEHGYAVRYSRTPGHLQTEDV